MASWAQPPICICMYVCRWVALPLASKRWGALPYNNPNSVINELLLRRLWLLHSLSTLLSRTLSYSHLSCEGSPIRGYPYHLNHKKSGNPFPPNYCSNNPRLMYFQLCIYFALAHTHNYSLLVVGSTIRGALHKIRFTTNQHRVSDLVLILLLRRNLCSFSLNWGWVMSPWHRLAQQVTHNNFWQFGELIAE